MTPVRAGVCPTARGVAVRLTLGHYRNRFCMFRTYYALAIGAVSIEGV